MFQFVYRLHVTRYQGNTTTSPARKVNILVIAITREICVHCPGRWASAIAIVWDVNLPEIRGEQLKRWWLSVVFEVVIPRSSWRVFIRSFRSLVELMSHPEVTGLHWRASQYLGFFHRRALLCSWILECLVCNLDTPSELSPKHDTENDPVTDIIYCWPS